MSPAEDYAAASEDGSWYSACLYRSPTVIGYLWASDSENARGYVPRPAAGAPAWRAEQWWIRHAVDAADRSLSPTQALRARIGLPEAPVGGRLDPEDEENTAVGRKGLERIAQGTP